MANPPDPDQNAMPAGLQALMSRADRKDKSPPPVEKWHPANCGDLDIRIAADGTWFYLGSPIGRKPLVQLFASVLRKDEDGRHYLVTPVEKIGITVDDAPFLAVELHRDGEGQDQVLTLRTNIGDVVRVDDAHPLRFAKEAGQGGLKPYVLVRGRLEALFTRALMYQLADLLEDGATGSMGVWSCGTFFELDPSFLDEAV